MIWQRKTISQAMSSIYLEIHQYQIAQKNHIDKIISNKNTHTHTNQRQ